MDLAWGCDAASSRINPPCIPQALEFFLVKGGCWVEFFEPHSDKMLTANFLFFIYSYSESSRMKYRYKEKTLTLFLSNTLSKARLVVDP